MFVALNRPIDDHVGDPAVLQRDIRPCLRVAIESPLRADHDAAEEAVTWIGHHIPPIPHQRRRLPDEWIGIVGVDAAVPGRDRLFTRIVADICTQGILRIKGQTDRREGRPALLHFIRQLDLETISHVRTQGQWHRLCTGRHRRRVFFQDIDLGIGVDHLDGALEVHLDGIRRVRIELHGGKIDRHDVEALHRRVGGTYNQRLRNLVPTAVTGRQLLQIRHVLIQHSQDAPCALGQLGRATVEVDVVPCLQPRSARLRHHEVVPLGDPDMDGVLPVGVTGIPLGQIRMSGQRPDHAFVGHRLQQPEYDRIAQVRPHHRRIGVAVDGAAEELRHIGIGGHAAGDGLRPEVEAAARRVGAAVQERHRRHLDMLGNRERNGLPRFQRHLDRLAWRIARRHDIDRMRHTIVQLHHELAETAVHVVPNRLRGSDVGQRTAPNRFPGFGIVVRRSDRLDDHRAEPAMTPGNPPQRMVVPEHGPDIRIDPEPLPDEFDRYDVLDRMIVLQGAKQRKLIALDGLDPPDFIAADIIRADQDLHFGMILRGILDGNDSVTLCCRLREHGVQGQRQPLVCFLLEHRKRPDRLLVRKSGDHAVR